MNQKDEHKATHKGMEDAIDAHVKATYDDEKGVFVTGWVVIASLSSPDYDDTSSDGYVTYTSQGLQHHGILGLLQVAIEERRAVGLMSTVSSFLSIDTDEEDDE